MSENRKLPDTNMPIWFDGKAINEVIFCEEFLRDYPMITVNGTFFTVNGIVNDENRLKKEIYDRIKPYVTSNIAKRVTNLLDVMRMECCADDLLLERILSRNILSIKKFCAFPFYNSSVSLRLQTKIGWHCCKHFLSATVPICLCFSFPSLDLYT